MCFVSVVFFFFKQKTAYDMRISDWSSDVCSSDLSIAGLSLILLLSSAGRGSAAPELIVNESAFACHHHGKQLMLSCPMPRQAYHKEGVGAGRFFCDQSFLPPSAEISTWWDRDRKSTRLNSSH